MAGGGEVEGKKERGAVKTGLFQVCSLAKKMIQPKPYKCVNCGKPAAALFKSYGPSVLKLTKCETCGGTVDKYIEYDPVIVMIDLVLMSREAQRHVLYNTEFKPFWKLIITLMMLETYGVWRTDSLISIGINAICQNNTSSSNSTHLSIPIELHVPAAWLGKCWAWTLPERAEDNDLFIWEKDFYIQFIATFCGIAVFLSTTYCLMYVVQYFSSQSQVPVLNLIKAFSLANMSILFTIPMLVWGDADTPPDTRTFHYMLVFAYSFVLFYNVYTVVYNCHMLLTVLILIMSHCAKFHTTFSITPHVRGLIS